MWEVLELLGSVLQPQQGGLQKSDLWKQGTAKVRGCSTPPQISHVLMCPPCTGVSEGMAYEARVLISNVLLTRALTSHTHRHGRPQGCCASPVCSAAPGPVSSREAQQPRRWVRGAERGQHTKVGRQWPLWEEDAEEEDGSDGWGRPPLSTQPCLSARQNERPPGARLWQTESGKKSGWHRKSHLGLNLMV